MGLPIVNITFQSAAEAVIGQGGVGILAVVLKDAAVTELTEYDFKETADIPANLSDTNKGYLNQALLGAPAMVKAVVLPETATDYSMALTYLETIKWNIMTIPGIADADVAAIVTWAKDMRDTKERKIMAVLPNCASPDHEAIINFATDDIKVGTNTYAAEGYLARIAGLIAGLPLTVAPTYQVLTEVNDVPHLTKSDADAAVDAGKLILYHDGEKVKIARGVTSLTTTTNKGADWKKIKVVRILDLVYDDVKRTIEDNYIGKVQNSYENKLFLCAAVNSYFEALETEHLLDTGMNRCDIDLTAQRDYLKSIGKPVDAMSDQEIKEANTDTHVFLTASVRPLDAIEDIDLKINL